MCRKLQCGALLFAVTLLVAADAPWVTKRIPDWNANDASQILWDSPWVRLAAPAVGAGLSAYQRREGGDMGAQGGGSGAGVAAVLMGEAGSPMSYKRDLTELARSGKLQIRWESALPIRAAEMKANENGAPVLDGDEYAIAVYAVALKVAVLEPKNLEETLRKAATLKIEGRKEAKPSRVAVMQPGGGIATVVYLFPRSLNITVQDERVEFSAVIGRIGVAQYFYPNQMQFNGKLEL